MLIIHSTSTSPTFNLATEEYLLTKWQDDLLFFYVNQPSVIIGCNQAIRNEVNLDYCAENNLQVIRRMSGGGAVFHDFGNLNFCFISNKTKKKSSLGNEFILPIVDVLTDMGVSVEIGKRKDLWLERKYKISGTASHVTKNRELHHGTLLYDTNLQILENALNPHSKDESVNAIVSVPSIVKNLRTHFEEQGLVTLSSIDFFSFFKFKLSDIFKSRIESFLSKNEIVIIQSLFEKKYISQDWTYKK